MNITAIENSLFTWISTVITPTVAIWENQNAPRPGGGYMGMVHNAERILGFNGYKSQPSGAQNTVSVTSDIELMLMLIGYGSNGASAIYLIFDALQFPAKRNDLYLAGLVYVANEGVKDIPEVVNSQIESRKSLDIRMRIGNVLTYPSNIIEHTDLGVILKEGDRVVSNRTIHI